jgi:hypothetical protein
VAVVWSTAEYYRDPLGIVHLKGVVQNSAPNQNVPIFVLPAGYRPELTAIVTGPSDLEPAGGVRLYITGRNAQPSQSARGSIVRSASATHG